LKASEKEVIDRVIEQMSDWSATAISNYAHKDMPWLVCGDAYIRSICIFDIHLYAPPILVPPKSRESE
jgi:uncharacterized phage-associated protein